MADIPFGLGEIDGEAVTIAELDFAEVASFTTFNPNNELLFAMIRGLDFSGRLPPIIAKTEQEAEFLQKSSTGYFIPTDEDVDMAAEVFGKWVASMAPIGLHSLAERGLVIPSADGNFKTHRSLDSILRVLRTPVEHISYRTSQVPVDEPAASPILRSSLYAVQSFSGDWMVAEHFQTHQHIRFICVPSGSKLASRVETIVAEGVAHSISGNLISSAGVEFRPFGVLIARTNEHGSNIVASAQLSEAGGEAEWYTPYAPDGDNKLIGSTTRKFGNIFSTATEVAQMAGAPYTQLDIRNGLEGWFRLGGDKEFEDEVGKLTHLPLHSQSDHIPDTIPDFFFEKDEGNQ